MYGSFLNKGSSSTSTKNFLVVSFASFVVICFLGGGKLPMSSAILILCIQREKKFERKYFLRKRTIPTTGLPSCTCYFAVHPMKSAAETVDIWTQQYDSYIFPAGWLKWRPVWFEIHPAGILPTRCPVKWHATSYLYESVNINQWYSSRTAARHYGQPQSSETSLILGPAGQCRGQCLWHIWTWWKSLLGNLW